MKMITKTSASGSTKQNQIVYCENDAHIKSRAAYVLLADKLLMQDENYLDNFGSLWDWLDAREKYLLRRQKENNGNLKCDYCGKEHLDIGGKRPEDLAVNNRNKNLATVDHIVPLANEGEKYNEDNMGVACKKCNGKKGILSLEDFLDKMPIEKLKKVAQFVINKASNSKELIEKLYSFK